MAELADAADSKSAEVHPSWGFNSPSRHQTNSQMGNELAQQFRSLQEKALGAVLLEAVPEMCLI